MRTSPAFRDDPLGKFVEPGRAAEAYAHGLTFEQIHARALAGELAPDAPPLELPE
jgi:hypothetical protein